MTRVLERDSQLAALRSYAEEARGGEGRMALISGEAGPEDDTAEHGMPASFSAWVRRR
jgi:hypothetical protein